MQEKEEERSRQGDQPLPRSGGEPQHCPYQQLQEVWSGGSLRCHETKTGKSSEVPKGLEGHTEDLHLYSGSCSQLLLQ